MLINLITISENHMELIEGNIELIEYQNIINDEIIRHIDELKSTIEEKKTEVKSEEKKTSKTVTFRCTGYCNCSTCCGKWTGSPTASGVMPVAGRTIAVDTSIIPFGTEVVINGHTYVAEDTGGAIKGNRIDIYFDSHEEALNFGVQWLEVKIL